MSSAQSLREFVTERLTAAAEEIFRVFEQTIVEYEAEIDRQRRLLDVVWNPQIKLHRVELRVCKVEVPTDQQLCNQERNPSLDHEDPGPPHVKEEQEELCTSQEGEQLVVKQETDHVMLVPTYEERCQDEPEPIREQQLLSHSSPVAERRDQKGNKHAASGLPGNNASQPKQRCRHGNTENSCKETIQKHAGGKRCVCNVCGKSFKFASRLKVHVRSHTGEKPYRCKTCGRAFMHNTRLRIHIRRAHTGERPYLCNTCGKRFTENNDLVKHQRVHTGERPYACNICGKTFKQISALNFHLKIHRR